MGLIRPCYLCSRYQLVAHNELTCSPLALTLNPSAYGLGPRFRRRMLSRITGLTSFGKVSLIMRFPSYDFPRSIKALSFIVDYQSIDGLACRSLCCACLSRLVHWSRRSLASRPATFYRAGMVCLSREYQAGQHGVAYSPVFLSLTSASPKALPSVTTRCVEQLSGIATTYQRHRL